MGRARWEGGLRTSLRDGGLDGTSEQELPNRASFPGFRFEVPFLVQIQIYGGHKDGVFRQGRVPRPIGPKVSQGLLDPCVSTMVWVLQYQRLHGVLGFGVNGFKGLGFRVKVRLQSLGSRVGFNATN